MGWSEKLTELGNSWFSPKQLSGWRRMFPVEVEHWKVWIARKSTGPIKLRMPQVRVRQLGDGGEAPYAKRETAQTAV